jgi:DNA-binding CsgD family transcriptional regulator/transposase-like protein
MARKREGTVHESAVVLQALERQLDGNAAARVRLLLAIQENPELTMEELAHLLDCAPRTTHRWWKRYRQRGLAGLVKGYLPPPPSAPLAGRLPSIETPADDRPAPQQSRDMSPRLEEFLGSLPTTLDVETWMRQFLGCMKKLVDDVDIITLRVNLSSDIESDDIEPSDHVIVDRPHPDDMRSSRRRPIRTGSVTTTPSQLLVAQLIGEGFASSLYQIPVAYDFYVDGTEYVGSMLLWRERHKSPISRSTLDMMKKLHRFIAFAFSDCVCRHAKREPDLRHFRHIIGAVAERIGLTAREAEIFTLQLAGANRDAIADHLDITKATVGKHISSIHRKAGTKNYTEIFAGWKPIDT